MFNKLLLLLIQKVSLLLHCHCFTVLVPSANVQLRFVGHCLLCCYVTTPSWW